MKDNKDKKDISASVFANEERILASANDAIELSKSATQTINQSLASITKSYEKLLKQVKRLTKVSDNQHRKLLNVQQQLNDALEKSDNLLLNILPKELAEELKETGTVIPQSYTVSILFTDFKGFTNLASSLTPMQLIKRLSESFDEFDHMCQKFNMEKIKTIGDAYMAAGGLPKKNDSHPLDAVKMGLAIRDFIADKIRSSKTEGREYWNIRIGIHTGEVIAGVIGNKKFAYDIWGDSVNIASRMESNAVPGTVNISKITYDLIKDQFLCKPRGQVEVKGKGMMEMFTVVKEL